MADIIDAARALIGDPRLSAYFHLGQPGRIGVQVVDTTSALGAASARPLAPWAVVTPAGHAIEAGRVALHVDRADCDGRAASFRWRLPIEGVSGAATLRRSGGAGWIVEEFRLVER